MIAVAATAAEHRSDVAVDGLDFPERDLHVAVCEDPVKRLKPALPTLLALLDVPVEDPQWQALDPPQRRQRTLDAVKRLLLRESQVRPLLLVFEDLHWIDTETQVLLDSLVETVRRQGPGAAAPRRRRPRSDPASPRTTFTRWPSTTTSRRRAGAGAAVIRPHPTNAMPARRPQHSREVLCAWSSYSLRSRRRGGPLAPPDIGDARAGYHMLLGEIGYDAGHDSRALQGSREGPDPTMS